MHDCHLSNIKNKIGKNYTDTIPKPLLIPPHITPPHPEIHYSEKYIPEFFSLKLTTCLTLIGKIKN